MSDDEPAVRASRTVRQVSIGYCFKFNAGGPATRGDHTRTRSVEIDLNIAYIGLSTPTMDSLDYKTLDRGTERCIMGAFHTKNGQNVVCRSNMLQKNLDDD